MPFSWHDNPLSTGEKKASGWVWRDWEVFYISISNRWVGRRKLIIWILGLLINHGARFLFLEKLTNITASLLFIFFVRLRFLWVSSPFPCWALWQSQKCNVILQTKEWSLVENRPLLSENSHIYEETHVFTENIIIRNLTDPPPQPKNSNYTKLPKYSSNKTTQNRWSKEE